MIVIRVEYNSFENIVCLLLVIKHVINYKMYS